MAREKNIENNGENAYKRTPPSERNVVTTPELIKLVSKKLNRAYPYWEIYYVVQATFRCFEDILKEGKTLRIGDCFTMEPKLVKAAKKYNFDTKSTFVKPAHYKPKFKPYKKLKDACMALPVDEAEEETEDE